MLFFSWLIIHTTVWMSFPLKNNHFSLSSRTDPFNVHFFSLIQVLCGNLTHVKPQTLKEGAAVTFTLRGLIIQRAAQLRLYGTVAASVKLMGRPVAHCFPLRVCCNLIILQTISLCGSSIYRFYEEESLFKPTLKHLTQLSPSILNSNAPCTRPPRYGT